MTVITKLQHDDMIEWPNGLGFTPCTSEYADLHYALDAIMPDGGSMDDLSADDYNCYHSMIDKQAALLRSGHLGKSERY